VIRRQRCDNGIGEGTFYRSHRYDLAGHSTRLAIPLLGSMGRANVDANFRSFSLCLERTVSFLFNVVLTDLDKDRWCQKRRERAINKS
jgi:hypothetical protein